jgi:hypothetical protein
MSAAVAVLLFIASFWSGMYVQRNPWIYSDFNPETAADATVQPKNGERSEPKSGERSEPKNGERSEPKLYCIWHECCRRTATSGSSKNGERVRTEELRPAGAAAEFDSIRRSAEAASGLFSEPSNSFCTDASSVPVQGS